VTGLVLNLMTSRSIMHIYEETVLGSSINEDGLQAGCWLGMITDDDRGR
jgi:hypothetical protein